MVEKIVMTIEVWVDSRNSAKIFNLELVEKN